MALVEFYYVAEIVAAVAVIGSLVYLGIQVKGNTKALRATAAQAYLDTNHSFVGLINQSTNLANVLVRGAQDLSNLEAGEMAQFSAFHDQAFMTFESNYYLWQDGVLDKRLWNTHRHALIELLRMPGMREWWQNRSHWVSRQFQDYVDRTAKEIDGRPMYWWAVDR